jgi:hypothetical protein
MIGLFQWTPKTVETGQKLRDRTAKIEQGGLTLALRYVATDIWWTKNYKEQIRDQLDEPETSGF